MAMSKICNVMVRNQSDFLRFPSGKHVFFKQFLKGLIWVSAGQGGD